MRSFRPLRIALFAPALLVAVSASAQPRAAECFYSADFETIDQFSGWDIGAFVMRQSPEGSDLGELIPAWEVGDADAANADGYFPVADQPSGNEFVMANDAASPCNCDMSAVALTSPVLDFSGRSNVSLECRVFNEGTLGAGPATMEGNIGGDTWIALSTIPTLAGEWQRLFIDLSAFDGQPTVRLRFNWSDGGGWSSGFALDDICLRERLSRDISITGASVGDATVSAFSTASRSLSYSAIPLEQAAPFQVSVALSNRGMETMDVTGVTVDITLNGELRTQASLSAIGNLLPGEDTLVVVQVDWIPDEVGELLMACQVNATGTDDDASDNSVTIAQRITGAGWDNGYGAMACDNGVQQGAIGGSDGFIAANRVEVPNSGSHAQGMSVQFGTGTQVGATIRAILMDGNFALIDTSARQVLTQADIDMIWNGGALYLPLSTSPELGIGDHFVGIQHLDASDDIPVQVGVGGDAPTGRSVLMEGLGFTVQYLRSTPMVRLHLEELGVGIADAPSRYSGSIRVSPNPASSTVQLTMDALLTEHTQAHLFDASGRMVRSWPITAVQRIAGAIHFSVEALAPGSYTAVISSTTGRWHAQVQVTH